MNSMPSIDIAGRKIGPTYRPFIIAEMSGNHNQSLERAMQIVDAAAAAGADALKLQTYTADTMTIDVRHGEFMVAEDNQLWGGQSLYDLYKAAHTPWEWHAPIMDRCKSHGLICFSTPFDASAVDFLEELNVPAYKVASFEITDLPLIGKIAKTGKPMIISTGMADVSEIAEAVATVRENGGRDPILLKCTSSYPADPEDSNLAAMPLLRDIFGCQIGLSDHTMGIGAAVAAVALGATVIEKHFTLSRNEGGVDAAFSLEPLELASLVTETKTAWRALGTARIGPTKAEKGSRIFRRSLYIVKDIARGEILTTEHCRAIRPGRGLPPSYLDVVLGRRVSRDLVRGTPLTWDAFQESL
jgi:pseudaminic acid synthase